MEPLVPLKTVPAVCVVCKTKTGEAKLPVTNQATHIASVCESCRVKRDPNQQAARQVEKITGSEPVRGEDLVSSEELKTKFREAKQAEAKRAKRRDG